VYGRQSECCTYEAASRFIRIIIKKYFHTRHAHVNQIKKIMRTSKMKQHPDSSGLLKNICFHTRHADVNQIKKIMFKVDQRDAQIGYLTKKPRTKKDK
jgi:hypothetical protein